MSASPQCFYLFAYKTQDFEGEDARISLPISVPRVSSPARHLLASDMIFNLVERVAPEPAANTLQIQLPSLDNTLGVLLIATFIGLILLGVTLHQAYRYARSFPHDSRWLKGLVGLAVSLETASSALSMHVCYYYLVTNYFRPQNISLGVWSTNLYPSVAGAAMIASQSFFARRVWLLEPRYRPIVVLSCTFSLTELGIFIAGTVIQFITNDPENKVFLQLSPIAFCLAMAADLLLTASLIRILHRKRTGFKGTDNMIDVLVLYSVNTGLLNGIFDLLTMILAFVLPHSSVWAAFGISGAKLYAITLLAALHSRSTIRVQGSAEMQDSEAVFGVSVSPGMQGAPSSHCGSAPPFRQSRHWNAHQIPSTSSVTDSGSDVIELKAMSVTLQGNYESAERHEKGEDAKMRRYSEDPQGILVIS